MPGALVASRPLTRGPPVMGQSQGGFARKLVFGQQPDREQQRIAGDLLLGAGDRAAVLVHFGQRHAGHPAPAVDVHHGVTQLERDAVIVQALHNVAFEPARIGHQLGHGTHFGAFQRHAAGHNQPDIPRTEDHDSCPTRSPSMFISRWAVPAV